MDIAEAFQIVIDLAKQNLLHPEEAELNNMVEEAQKQQEAVNMIEDLAVNEYGDD